MEQDCSTSHLRECNIVASLLGILLRDTPEMMFKASKRGSVKVVVSELQMQCTQPLREPCRAKSASEVYQRV